MSTSATPSGLDLQWVDESFRPQDDLYSYVNGKWLKTHVIPDDRSQDSAFRALHDQAEADSRAIIQETDEPRIANLYASFMNTSSIEELGTKPLQPLLHRIKSVDNKADFTRVLGEFQRDQLVALFGGYVDTDSKDATRYVFHLSQSGLGLPDESFYKEDAYAEIRDAYVQYLTRIAELVELPNPEELAKNVMALETEIADVSWDRVTNRDAEKTYTLMKFSELQESAPTFEWDIWHAALGAPEHALDEVVVRQPSFVTAAVQLLAKHDLALWKQWLSIHIASHCAAYLNDELVETQFDFYGRTLSGTPQLRERWKRGVSVVEGALGEDVGRIYVQRHYPPLAGERMEGLVNNLIEAYRESISALDWMGEETREKALAKLEKFIPKIGYPKKWKDYSALETKPDDLLGNVIRAGRWETNFNLSKLGQPVDRDEWFMTPQTVNAYYNPQMNEIVFPAAILQPPFFHFDADDAVNYGGIGAVIGHEIGHGFDDQGSRFDGDGNMIDWWTETDREEFERRTQALIEQYNVLSPRGLADHKVNGALTVGENIGDLGGLTIALKAYAFSLNGQEPPVIDGMSGVQRVFMGWANVWRALTRDEEAIRRLAIDPHSPPDLRCNAVIRNVDAFYDAFNVTESDALYLPPEERIHIW